MGDLPVSDNAASFTRTDPARPVCQTTNPMPKFYNLMLSAPSVHLSGSVQHASDSDLKSFSVVEMMSHRCHSIFSSLPTALMFYLLRCKAATSAPSSLELL
jgi:hypothetical protein